MDGSWKAHINPKRQGAGYFLAQSQELRCCPQEYASFRNGCRKQQEKIIAEWTSWMRDFASSHHEVLREAAKGAPKLSRDTVKAVRKTNLQRRREQELINRANPQVKSNRVVKSWLKRQHSYRWHPPQGA
ncbi:hypothetical protein BGZ67_001807 [Mortierella alpina]|nr:hypothetical protein BGZ67_001807 [Mortierella alpina]